MLVWPPQLADLKHEMRVTDSRNDAALQNQLDAAIDRVSELRAGDFDFTGSPPLTEDELGPDEVALPSPSVRIILGTMRLAWRWYNRTKSPDGLVDMGNDLGSARVPSIDPDIEQMLGVGRHREPMVG